MWVPGEIQKQIGNVMYYVKGRVLRRHLDQLYKDINVGQ